MYICIMKTITIILIGIVLLFIFSMINYAVINSQESDIKEYFIKNNKEVKTIDHRITTIGSPFYYVNKGQHIFKVELTDGEVWWVRTGMFSNDYEKDKK